MAYSWRGRIGLLLPAVNTTMERDFWRMAPEGMTVHATRFESGLEGSAENLQAMAGSAADAARLLAFARPGATIFGCTSGSFVGGPDGNRALETELEKIIGTPTITTSTAMTEALQAVGAHRVGVVTPYVETTNARLRTYLEQSGFEVLKLKGLGILDMFDHAAIPRDAIYDAALSLAGEGLDAVFIACTQVQITDEIPILEEDLGVPVVGAVQSSMWAALRRMGKGHVMPGRGRLFAAGCGARPGI